MSETTVPLRGTELEAPIIKPIENQKPQPSLRPPLSIANILKSKPREGGQKEQVMSISEFLDRYDEIFGTEEDTVIFEYWSEDEGRWLLSDER